MKLFTPHGPGPAATRSITAALTTTVAAVLALNALPAVAALAPVNLRCEYRSNPLGIDSPTPRLSWIVESEERGQRQTAYRILVARTEPALAARRAERWDSGKVSSSATLDLVYAGAPLQSGDRCFWTVQVWDKNGEPSEWSQPARWEMALLREADWSAKWINDGIRNPARPEDFYRDDPAPLFRKEFKLAKPVGRARLHVTGLGYVEARLNGQRVGDEVLGPGWTRFDRRVFYSTFDVAEALRAGTNCLGVTLGNGWWNPLPLRLFGKYNLRDHLPTGRPRFIAQLDIEFTDGSKETIASDESWKVHAGPVRFNSLYLGEVYDAREEAGGWDEPGFADATWRPARLATEPVGPLQAQPQPPVRVTERFPAVRVSEPQPGVFIYDLGQNFSGWAGFRFRAAAGTKMVLRYGELLNKDGSLNPLTSVCGQIKGRRRNAAGVEENIGGPGAPAIAWQGDTYLARGGGEETYTPRFTFHGFRYVEVTGLPHALPLEAVTGLRLNADVTPAGSFACSNEQFNRIQAMCRRTFLANLFSVQSDCPHRERFAYGGDIVATSEALMLNFDMAAFYAKTVADFADSAQPDGMFTDTAPFVGIQYCGVGWAMAHPLLVAQLERYYGNRRLTGEQYEAAKRWLLLVASQNEDGIMQQGLSDHESLTPNPPGPMVTPLFVQSARLLAALARGLQRADDAARFEAIAHRSGLAYQRQFLDPATGQAGPGTQASQAFALYSDLVPPAQRPAVLAFLLDDIQRVRKGHLSTGIMGTKFLLDVLSREGHADVAYGLVNQTESPGWGWMLAHGATTLWEHWQLSENTYSHSHPMFGSVSQWFINWLGGIQPHPAAHGFDRLVIRPQTVPDLQWVQCSYNSTRGRIVSNWRRDGGRLQLEIVIPANTTAEVHVPTRESALVTEGGRPVAEAGGVRLVRREPGVAVLEVAAGRYRFESPQ